jgi:hypothetical protein
VSAEKLHKAFFARVQLTDYIRNHQKDTYQSEYRLVKIEHAVNVPKDLVTNSTAK